MISNRDLLAYGPSQEDVVACVKTDAEAASEAVSLAVHQPLRFERRVIGGQSDHFQNGFHFKRYKKPE
jgi:hypothetical protein